MSNKTNFKYKMNSKIKYDNKKISKEKKEAGL
jgi:hypothetical protein